MVSPEKMIYHESIRYFRDGNRQSLLNLAEILSLNHKSFTIYNNMLYKLYEAIWNKDDSEFPEVRQAKDLFAKSYHNFIQELHAYLKRYFDLAALGPRGRGTYGDPPVMAILFPLYRPRHTSMAETAAAYARAITSDLGYRCFMVSTHCYPRLEDPPRMEPPVWFPDVHATTGWQVLEGEGEAPCDVYVTTSGPSFGPAKIAEMLQLLQVQRVDGLIGAGGFNVIADLAAIAWPTLCLESSRDEAVTFAHSVLSLGEDVPYFHRNRADLYPVPRGLFRLNPTLPLPPRRNMYQRGMFGLGKEDFLAVVIGYRINQEIDDDFVAMMIRSLAAVPRLRFLFAGIETLGCLDRIPEGLRDRLIPLGVVPEIRDLMAISDCFVSTRRQGGGQGALVSLAEAKPVLALPVGDIGSIMGPGNCVPDMSAMSARLCELATDRRAYAAAATVSIRIRRRYRFSDNLPLVRDAFDHARTVFAAAGEAAPALSRGAS